MEDKSVVSFLINNTSDLPPLPSQTMLDGVRSFRLSIAEGDSEGLKDEPKANKKNMIRSRVVTNNINILSPQIIV